MPDSLASPVPAPLGARNATPVAARLAASVAASVAAPVAASVAASGPAHSPPDASPIPAPAAGEAWPGLGGEGWAEIWPDAFSAISPELGLVGGLGLMLGLLLGALLGGLATAAIGARLRARAERGLGDRFTALSNEALDRTSDRFLTLASERLGALERSNVEALTQREQAVAAMVQPLRESLSRVDEKLQQVETAREGHYQSLTKHLEMVATSHRELERQTHNLSKALHTPNVRGRWGEMQLRRVVELAGMLSHCDFREQTTVAKGEVQADGKKSQLRPDLVVHLPGGRQIVIDAKAPLQAYLAASEAPDEATRTEHLREHARHVRRHVDELSSRAYWSRLSDSPDFVVLFLPGETSSRRPSPPTPS